MVGFVPPCRVVGRHLSDMANQLLVDDDGKIEQDKRVRIVDLCSGSGGPLPFVSSFLPEQTSVLLTDKFPSFGGADSDVPPIDESNENNENNEKKEQHDEDRQIAYMPRSVDAMACRLDCDIRTLFASFHHFTPDQATGILKDAVRNQQRIAIYEFTYNSIGAVLVGLVVLPLVALLSTPLIVFRQVRRRIAKGQACNAAFLFDIVRRLFFTFVVPIVPLVIWLDGTVSHLRTYSPAELLELVRRADRRQQYDWAIEQLDILDYPFLYPVPITVLSGRPKWKGAE
eukprot:TRINITY_DN59680_c0_g1_i2.p1 TRINITY_DN59680_c0_g1~~TRINITY_DN59680_c0_g1_i2.p1  ORF type:complete len:285 (+),score=154.95 TRINITY_DN59680_c0_g1_i2:350-1204(+)